MSLDIAQVLQAAASSLSGHSESPRLDAELLLSKILGMSRSGLVVHGAAPIAAARRVAYEQLLQRRIDGAPIAYLTGTREFWSLNLSVTPDVLVPRPETEVLVELALGRMPADSMTTVLDLGTGSGAIALAIASERPLARITAVDVSPAALAVAAGNARSLAAGNARIAWRLGSWFEPVSDLRFDVIVSNPPYVASTDPALRSLTSEPLLALAPGPSGLEALSAIVAGAARHLNSEGWLLLEHGSTQADEVAGLLDRHGFRNIRSHTDYAGKPRVTLGSHHSQP